MSVIQDHEYAQLANRVYSRTAENRTPVPKGWVELVWKTDDPVSGFSYGAYQKGNDIVISFTGSNENFVRDFGVANVPAGLGLSSAQITQAVTASLDIMAMHPTANISFTGHSLGGGLASVLAIFFEKEATTFDPAPFELSARNPIVLSLLQIYLQSSGYSNESLNEYVRTLGSSFSEREAKVRYHYIDGEILQYLRTDATTIGAALPPKNVGDQTIVDGVSLAGRTSLHSMTLLAAMITSTAFRDILPRASILLELVFDNSIYATDPQESEEINFLDKLYIAQVSSPSTPLLDRFADDLNKIIDSGTVGRPDLNKALIAAAMDYYYINEPGVATGLFSSGNGGIHFDFSSIPGDDLQSRPLLAAALAKLDDKSAHFIRSYAQDVAGWHIQSGTSALNWISSSSASQAAVGGMDNDVQIGGDGHDLLVGLNGDDVLRGHIGADLLIGGDGADELDGGEGSDYLYGGVGRDTYSFNGDFGNDWITDSDGLGQITVDGQTLSALNAKKVLLNFYKDDSTGWTFFNSGLQGDGTSTLVITNRPLKNPPSTLASASTI